MEITMSTVTYADWRDIIKTAVKQAKRGNPQARKFLADYLLGLAIQKHEISGPDGSVLTVEYINDWRTHSAPGTASGADSG